MKRLRFILAILMAMTWAQGAWANYGDVTIDGIKYGIYDSDYGTGAFIISVASDITNLAPVSTVTVNGVSYDVKGFTYSCFSINQQKNWTSITLPSTFVSLNRFHYGEDVVREEEYPNFQDCKNLQSVDLSATQIKEIPSQCFRACSSMTTISFPSSLEKIGVMAFAGCSALRELSLGSVEINDYAFWQCTSLTTVTINQIINYNDCSYIFRDCTALKTLTIREWNVFSNFNPYEGLCDGCTNLETVNLPNNNNLVYVARNMFRYCEKLTQTFTFSSIQNIESGAFAGVKGLNLWIRKNEVVGLGFDCFEGTTGTLTVKYGLKQAYEQTLALKNSSLTIVEYDVPTPQPLPSYQCVAAESLPSWFAQYTTAQLKTVKRLKVMGTLSDDGKLVLGKMCGNGSSGLSLTSLDLTELSNDVLPMFYTSQALDTLMLPRAATRLGNNFFNSFKSNLVVVAPWTEPIALPTPGTVSGKTLIVPRGSLYGYKAASGWNGFNTIKTEPLEGNANLLVVSSKANKPVELWVDGEKIGEIDKRGGTLSETVDGAASIELRVPAQYLDKILLNGSDVKSVLISSAPTDAAYMGYMCYYIEDFTPTTTIEVAFAGVPEVFETYGLMFVVDGGPGSASVNVTYGDGTNESLDIAHDGNGSTYRPLNYNATLHTGAVYATTKEIERIVVTAHPENDEPSIMYFNPGYANQTQVTNNESMYSFVYDGNGTYTYTLPGENMTSSNISMYFPPTQENNIKTTIAVNGDYQVKYFFYDYDPGLWYHNVKTSDEYIQGQTTVTHNGSSDSYGNVFIYLPESNRNFRVIFNGEVVPFNGNGNVCLEWTGGWTTSYDSYMQEKLGYNNYTKVPCWQLSISDDAIKEDSWILIDDGTTPLDQIVSPLQIAQNVTTMDVFDKVYLIDKNGNETVWAGSGNVTTWPKGEPMTVEASRLLGNIGYEASLIVDGTEVPLHYDAEKNRFTGYELSEVNTSHTFVLQMKKVKYFFTAYVGKGNSVAIAEINEDGNVIENGGGSTENISMSFATTSGLRLYFMPAEGSVLTGLAMDGSTIALDDERLTRNESGDYVLILPAGTISSGDHQIYASFSRPEGDLNGDGDVNIADVTKLVNMVLEEP